LKKDNPWLTKLSLGILSLHENGIMEELDRDWISNNTYCQSEDSFPSKLRISNMADLFTLVAGGAIMGIFLTFIEIGYTKYKYRNFKELERSRKVIVKWRRMVREVRQILMV
jgi:hypothetical protein